VIQQILSNLLIGVLVLVVSSY